MVSSLFHVYLRNIDLIWQVFELWIVIIQVQHSAKDNFCTLSKKGKEKWLERLKSMIASLFVRPNRQSPTKFPEVSYSKALKDAGLKTLFHRREELCSSLFKEIVESDQHKLSGLLPAHNDSERYNFRTRRMFSIPYVKTKRFGNTFIMHFANKQRL